MPKTDDRSSTGNFPPVRQGRLSAFIHIARAAVDGFIEDEALTRGGSIAFYAVTSIAPVLLIVVSIAGLVFGREAAMGAIVAQFGGLMGHDSAKLLQTAIISAAKPAHGITASIVGIGTLLVTASGVFGEMQSALNVIWKVKPKTGPVSHLIRARAASLGLVAALGFLLMISLVVSTALNAFANYLNTVLPFAPALLLILHFIISYTLLAVLFAAIYKVLPDRDVRWGDVIAGAMLTTLLFTIGKFLISLYLGSSSIASSYGAAGSLIIVLLWVYYSAQLFLLGAEFTKAYAARKPGSGGCAPGEQTQSVVHFDAERTSSDPGYGH
ncbi:MAG: YihY/virulence factor BrkB family protein [Blastocatellia bacterium]|nr:YihY/virulence factor BrkB family protein [Blastocatellia bacterium]